MGKILAICSAGTVSRKICAARGSRVSAMSMPASPRRRADQLGEIGLVGRETRRGDIDPHRPLVAQEVVERLAALESEGELEEVLRRDRRSSAPRRGAAWPGRSAPR